ncbi:hypothetical protein LMG31506_04289 [Cupriavidus yeoncheonensis]|uniref:Uncharacterized protein n=1 Tax=Cupriavidus yeoncheonensis TaxID=1462994 RepID=A0A916IZZ9_9BURK|nr:hypothetical protein [Cupriavidus yeoncheonensis]CAG2150777.1 hypothetical protein LMG31506_04289 [Cupriavidus yeoncheonensis]
MNTTLDAGVLSRHTQTDDTVKAVHHRDIIAAFTAQPSPERVAVLHMLYPRTDARTHRSLDHLVGALHNHGLHEVATLVEREAHYLVFKDAFEAWRALHEIRHDSLAIGVHLYYRGLTGDAAENALDIDAHRAH